MNQESMLLTIEERRYEVCVWWATKELSSETGFAVIAPRTFLGRRKIWWQKIETDPSFLGATPCLRTSTAALICTFLPFAAFSSRCKSCAGVVASTCVVTCSNMYHYSLLAFSALTGTTPATKFPVQSPCTVDSAYVNLEVLSATIASHATLPRCVSFANLQFK